MKIKNLFFLCYLTAMPLYAEAETTSWWDKLTNGISAIWHSDQTDFYFSGYAWHNRWTYSPEKIKKYNELAWGGGIGKTYTDTKGNTHSLSVIAFADSHNKFEPVAGYYYQYMVPVTENTALGLGFTAVVTTRADLFKGRPFVGALPWFSLNYKKVSLGGTYIPGTSGNGNVLFLIGKVSIDG